MRREARPPEGVHKPALPEFLNITNGI